MGRGGGLEDFQAWHKCVEILMGARDPLEFAKYSLVWKAILRNDTIADAGGVGTTSVALPPLR